VEPAVLLLAPAALAVASFWACSMKAKHINIYIKNALMFPGTEQLNLSIKDTQASARICKENATKFIIKKTGKKT
jgi:hypothetical protein